MKTYTFLCILILLNCWNSYSQSCIPDGIGFYSQGEIDEFQYLYPDCTIIEGNVVIQGNDITNLLGLDVVTSIEGFLTISSTSLSNLEGLENLGSVYENLTIYDNEFLENTNALSNLDTIGGNLYLYNNSILSDISGFEKITSIPNSLTIGNHDSLVSLFGLHNITFVGNDLSIGNCFKLVNLNGLNNITKVGNNFGVSSCENMTSFFGINNLASVGGHIVIGYNYSLIDMSALLNLDSINGPFVITGNASLESLYGLDNIDPSTITDLTIKTNPNLCNCDVNSVCNYLTNPNGSIEIFVNKFGCDSKEEILTECLTNNPERIFLDKMSVYPNPTHNFVFIELNNLELNSDISYEVKSLTGDTYITKTIENSTQTVDLSSFDEGMYIIMVRYEDHASRVKVVKL